MRHQLARVLRRVAQHLDPLPSSEALSTQDWRLWRQAFREYPEAFGEGFHPYAAEPRRGERELAHCHELPTLDDYDDWPFGKPYAVERDDGR